MSASQQITLDYDVDFSVDDVPDLPAVLHRVRSEKPVAWVKGYGEPALLLTSYDLVSEMLSDEESFPAPAFYGQLSTEIMGRHMLAMTGTEHRVNRALVSPSFRPRLMPYLQGAMFEPLAHQLIDEFEARGSAELVSEFTRIYPARIIMGLMGLPLEMDAEVHRWAVGVLDWRTSFDEAMACSEAFAAFVDPILQQRRVDPGDDLISMLATTELDGERLTDEEIFGFLKLLFPAGADTTYLNLGSTLFALLTYPDEMTKLREDLASGCRWAAEEGLRWYPAVAAQTRTCPADTVWHGIAIPAGTLILSSLLAANRDPAVFPDPDRFDVRRRPNRAATFGHGVHVCLGSHLARAEMEVALRVLLERLPKLRWSTTEGVRLHGVIGQSMRGPNKLPVRFD